MKAFERVQPASWDEAVAALAAARRAGVAAEPKGAGTDLLDRLKERTAAPDRLVDLRRLPGADAIVHDGGFVRIGALVTLARAARELATTHPAVAQACGDAATPQIRNVATLAGSLCQRPRCWYFRSADFACLKKGGGTCFAQEGDNRYHAIFGNRTCAAVHASSAATGLLAHGASVKTLRPGGRRTIALADLFTSPEANVVAENILEPAEVITEIVVPVVPSARSAYRGLKQKRSFDWPLVEAAVAFETDGDRARAVRIVLGAVAHSPMRAMGAEALLEGKRIDGALAAQAGEAAIAGATPLAMNGYKLALARAAVRRAVLGAAGLPDGTEG